MQQHKWETELTSEARALDLWMCTKISVLDKAGDTVSFHIHHPIQFNPFFPPPLIIKQIQLSSNLFLKLVVIIS